ncbi:hypothetical protein GQ457_18G010810 [Hibiscus cannabinus]
MPLIDYVGTSLLICFRRLVFCPFFPLILNYISTSSLQVQLIGVLGRAFNPTIGVRQGNSISPYFFKSWMPFQLVQGGIHISHLLFADDLILYAQVSLDQVPLLIIS